jgi:hypothetical protein
LDAASTNDPCNPGDFTLGEINCGGALGTPDAEVCYRPGQVPCPSIIPSIPPINDVQFNIRLTADKRSYYYNIVCQYDKTTMVNNFNNDAAESFTNLFNLSGTGATNGLVSSTTGQQI